jgi:flavin reductase (DIM6/NTAB) family NADH-FMN oxidoreductase RutF
VRAPEPSGGPDPGDYRYVISRFATGVSVVSTVHEGVRYGMTVNSLTSVSLRPLLVLFCCEHDASLHEPVLASGRWGVSILTVAQQEAAAWFAKRGARGVDQFAGQETRLGAVTGVPLLTDALAWLECRTWATYDGGDHTIVVGEVLDVATGVDADPLLYYRSDYRTTT